MRHTTTTLLTLAMLCCVMATALARRNYPTHRRAAVSDAEKRRIFRVGRHHPTLSDSALAKTLARHPATSKLGLTWSAAEVQRMRSIGALPTQPQRDAWLASLTARYLRRLPTDVSLDRGLNRVSARHSGASKDSLLFMARYHPQLARQILVRLSHQGARPEPPPTKVSVAEVKVLGKNLSRGLLERMLARPDSPLVQRMRRQLERLDRHNTNNMLSPKRDISQIQDPELKTVMERVYKEVGKRTTLSIDEIARHLPAAIAAVARARKPTAVTNRVLASAVSEALHGLSVDYNRKVVDGALAPDQFRKVWSIRPDHWANLKGRLPRLFVDPATLPLDSRRRDALAPAYAQMVAGKLTARTFYYRTGISERVLAVLQAADPKRFPRPGGAPVYQATARGQHQQARDNLLKTVGNGLEKRRRPSPTPKNTTAQAELLGKRAWQIVRRDLFVTAAGIARELNTDPAFVAKVGTLDTTRYQQLRALAKPKFPPLGHTSANTKLVTDQLARDVGALKKSGASLEIGSLTGVLQRKYPKLKPTRVERLRRERPELFRKSTTRKSKSPKRTTNTHASTGRKSTRDPIRAGLPTNEVGRLLLELSPPGTNDRQLATALNSWLRARGLPAYKSGTIGGALKVLYRDGGVRAANASRVAEVLGEYARTAKRGTTHAQILARVRRDHPRISAIELGRYQALWRANPVAYPALQPFLKDGVLALFGKGKREPKRFRGKWNPERAVIQPAKADPVLGARLARLSQYARIAPRLPVLDGLVADLKGATPLRKHNVLMVSHLLGSTVALTDALRAAGASVARSIIVGTPYGTNAAVKKTLEHEGYDVRLPRLSTTDYRRQVERAVREMADRYRKDPRKKPVLVLDDGGQVTDILHKPEFADVIRGFRVVEQTTRGVTLAERRHLRLPVVSIAEAPCKRIESIFIGRGVATRVAQGMERMGRSLRGKRVAIVGYGLVGRAIARALHRIDRSIIIDVVEPSSVRAKAAGRRYNVVGKATALARADVVIGATGHESVKLADMRRMKNGAIFASASSKRMEFEMGQLQKVAKRTVLKTGNPLVTLPSAKYKLGKKSLIVLGDGWPVNFDGDVEDIPARQIQITRGAMFAAAIQAAGLNGRFRKNQRVVDLAPAADRRIRQLFAKHRRHPIVPGNHQDPGRWSDTLRDLSQHLGANSAR